jgi:uncharacterized membrane protein
VSYAANSRSFFKYQISGHGLALASVAIEQDAAYWEAHIEILTEGSSFEIMFGVATKKDRKFYNALEEQEEGTYDLATCCTFGSNAYLLSNSTSCSSLQIRQTQMGQI